MSAPIDDGGPAFPWEERDANGQFRQFSGMTMRDYFASRAVLGMCSNGTDWSIYQPEKLAAAVFRIADAMLAARKEPK